MGDWKAPEAIRSTPDSVCFQDFSLNPRILRALVEELGFTECTPIQAMALPHALEGKDLAGRAQTGTGKTAAFLVTVLERLLKEPGERAPNQPFALVLAPTRELAVQIDHDVAGIGAFCGVRHMPVYGGVDYDRQKQMLADGIDLVSATPGRLIDYLRQGAINLSKLSVLVIDEADRMLDMGFIPDVRRIVGNCPQPNRRQTMLFSATLTEDIMNLAAKWMRPSPVILEAAPDQVVAEGVEEVVYAVASREKLALLLWILRNESCRRVLIFRNRRRDVEELCQELFRHGVACEMLSGDVPQRKRMHILEQFRAGTLPVVVATDVAGRGIHIENVTHVINFDMPYEAEDYVHRIGRTGRAGQRGRAISFAGDDCAFVIPDIEEFIDRPLPISQVTEDMLTLPEPVRSLPKKERPRPRSADGNERHPRSRDRRGRRGPPRRHGPKA